MKLKNLLNSSIAIFTTAIISNVSAMEYLKEINEEKYNKKIEFSEYFKSNEYNKRDKIKNNLLSEFTSDLKKEYIEDLKSIRNYYNTGYDFGDKNSNYNSLYNWLVYTRSVFALYKLGSKEDGIMLEEEYDRAKRRLEMIDFYSGNKDYKYCLSGIWCIVATFDEEERKNLLTALKKGEEIPKDETLIKIFESLN